MTVRPTRPPERAPALSGCDSRQPLNGLWALSLALLALAVPGTAAAQPATPAAATPGAPAKTVIAQNVSSPGWSELTVAQRGILQPLAPTWASLNQGHKRKWLEMARSYPSLSTEEQAKMQGRMKEWVALSPQQRAQARLNFAKTKELSKELTAEEKKAKWEAYQSLSDEEKRKLAARAPSKPVGAAPASKPVSRQKLATIPSPADLPKGKPAPKIAVSQSMDSSHGVAPGAAPAPVPGVPAQPH